MEIVHMFRSYKVEEKELYIAKYHLERKMNYELSKKYSNNYSVISKNFILISHFDKHSIFAIRLYSLVMNVIIEIPDNENI